MNLIAGLYAVLTAVSRWVEGLRVALLVRIYGIDKNEKSPIPWRKREGLPSLDQWPKTKDKDEGLVRYAWITGKVKVGPVRPVPAKIDKEPV